MRIGNKLYWYEMGRTGRTGKPQSCKESQRPLLRPGPFLIIQLMVNETWPQAIRWESHTDFPWGHRFMPGSKTLARAFLLLLLPQARILDTKAACADSKVDLGSCGSHGVNGCPGSGFDVKLQSWPWKLLLRYFAHCGYHPAPGRSRARCSPAGVVNRPVSQLVPRPNAGFPLIYVWGSRCLFSPQFPLISSPEPRSFLPQELLACNAPNCPVGARFNGDTQGLKIVTVVHPIGPSICCLIYE